MIVIKKSLFGLISLVAMFSLACNKTSSAGSEPGNPAKAAQKSNPIKAESKVARIVFVGQKQACECTRKRIDTTWNNLNEVLKAKPNLTVKRIQRDVNAKETEKMTKLSPMMVAPGIYFIGQQEELIKLLQGEISKEQIEEVL